MPGGCGTLPDPYPEAGMGRETGPVRGPENVGPTPAVADPGRTIRRRTVGVCLYAPAVAETPWSRVPAVSTVDISYLTSQNKDPFFLSAVSLLFQGAMDSVHPLNRKTCANIIPN